MRAAKKALTIWKEALLGIAVVVGWCLVTLFVVVLTDPLVWPLSIGLLLLSLSGWRFLFAIFFDGMYLLAKRPIPPRPPTQPPGRG